MSTRNAIAVRKGTAVATLDPRKEPLPTPAYKYVAEHVSKTRGEIYLDCPLARRASDVYTVYEDKGKYGLPFCNLPLADRNEKGVPHISVRNTGDALEVLGITVRHDRFADRVELQRVDDHDRLSDGALRLILTALETSDYRPRLDRLYSDVLAVAEANAYDSMQERFDALETAWDGEARLDKWMNRVLRTKDDAYHDFWSSRSLIVAVMRVRRATLNHPIPYKYLPVLESPQDGRKSSALRILGFTSYFTDDLKVGSDAKETMELTGGVLIAELSELAARKSDIESQKAFISKSVDKARPAYGRVVREIPRRFMLFASTNSSTYLKDATGDVRYIPIACDIGQSNPADTEWLKANLDQLWGEAAARERKMWEADWKEIYPPQELSQSARLLQDERYDGGDAYENLKIAFSHAFEQRPGLTYAFVSSAAAATIAGFGGIPLAQNPMLSRTLKEAMTRLGWRKKTRRLSDGKEYAGYEFGVAYGGKVDRLDIIEPQGYGDASTYWLTAAEPPAKVALPMTRTKH